MQPCVIGINAKGELGLGDYDQRKTFCVQQEIRDKRIRQCAIGKSGFVIALSEQVIDPQSHSSPNIPEYVPDIDMDYNDIQKGSYE